MSDLGNFLHFLGRIIILSTDSAFRLKTAASGRFFALSLDSEQDMHRRILEASNLAPRGKRER
jgi:hypothetical protein